MWEANFLFRRFFDRLADYGLLFFRPASAGVAEVYLVMEPALPKIRLPTVGPGILLHDGHGGGFLLIGAYVHALDAEPLLPAEKLHPGKIPPLLFRQ